MDRREEEGGERTIDGRGEERGGEERRGVETREEERLKKEGRRKTWKYMYR